MAEYMQRAKDIESEYGMTLLTFGRAFKDKKLIISNSIIFPLYYFFFFVAWVIVWIMNIFR